MKKISIAIDGFSACGKSTLAKDLAKKLNYKYIDSGAMYRAIALFALQNNLIGKDFFHKDLLINNLNDKIDIGFILDENQKNCVTLNEKNVEKEIRSMVVSTFVSNIAAIPEIREKMVELQRKLGEEKAIVMDGRDIGTVVFPTAELKLFVTADIKTRVQRRFLELEKKDEIIDIIEIEKNLIHRDLLDTQRKDSPLIQAPDAIVIDNSNITKDEQLEIAYKLAVKFI